MTCSEEFPQTDVFYDELSDDTPMIVCLVIGGLFTVLCVLIYVDELIFIKKKYVNNTDRLHKTILLLGLYPVICMTSLVSLLVPTSTMLMEAASGCYIAICIYTFVSLIISYFGNENRMIEQLADETVRLNLPPCCCCLCCILRPIKLTHKTLDRLKWCCLQSVIVIPVGLLVAAIMWTDGRYKQELDFTNSYPYIFIPIGVSTLLSMYGMVVLYRASLTSLRSHRIAVKFVSLQLMVLLNSLQRILFNALAQRGVPSCVGTRDSNVRGTAINHCVLVVECFLLSLLARSGYRKPEVIDTKNKKPEVAEDNFSEPV